MTEIDRAASQLIKVRAIVPLALAFSFAGCAMASAAPVPAPAAESELGLSEIRAELEAVFAARARAFQDEDYATLIDQVSPAFTAIRPDGSRMTRDDLAMYLRRNLDRWVRIVRQSNVIEAIRLEGRDAVVDMRQDLARIQIVDGREALVESGVLQTETWTRTAQGWKLLSVRDEREQRVTVEGRPIG